MFPAISNIQHTINKARLTAKLRKIEQVNAIIVSLELAYKFIPSDKPYTFDKTRILAGSSPLV